MRRRKFSALSTSNSIGGGSVASGLTNATASQNTVSASIVDGVSVNTSDGSSIAEEASMRPLAPPARKRRRTIVDAFSSINLNKKPQSTIQLPSSAAAGNTSNTDGGETGEETEGCDADSSQAVAENDEITTSSIEDDPSMGDSDDDGLYALSDKQNEERKVMFELVFGPLGTAEESVMKNAAGAQIDQLIQNSRHPATPTFPYNQRQAHDDTKINPPYARTLSMQTSGNRTTTSTSSSTSMGLTRSNSLPDIWLGFNNDRQSVSREESMQDDDDDQEDDRKPAARETPNNPSDSMMD